MVDNRGEAVVARRLSKHESLQADSEGESARLCTWAASLCVAPPPVTCQFDMPMVELPLCVCQAEGSTKAKEPGLAGGQFTAMIRSDRRAT